MAARRLSIFVLGTLLLGASAVPARAGRDGAESGRDGEIVFGQASSSPSDKTPGAARTGPATAVASDTARLPPAPSAAMAQDDAAAAVISDAAGACKTTGCDPTFLGPAGRFWFKGDYLYYSTKGMRLPPLITATPAGSGELPTLDNPNTLVLFGGSRLNAEEHPGFQLQMGMWLDCCHKWGIEGEYFDLRPASTGFSTGQVSGNNIQGRPIISAGPTPAPGTPGVELIGFPPGFDDTASIAGMVNIDVSTYFQSAGFRLRRNLCSRERCCESDCCQSACACGVPRLNGFRLDMIGGYRFYRLLDSVVIRENDIGLLLPPFDDPTGVGTALNLVDSFRTKNEFQGGELGLIANIYRGRWSFEMMGKVALGNNHQIAKVGGGLIETVPNEASQGFNGSLLAYHDIIGSHYNDEFGVIPELGLEIGYQLTCCLRTYVGYNILYWDKVARAGEQISLTVPQLTEEGGPTFAFHQSSFWSQGLRVGAELRF
jgi:hypothetical protein